MFIKLLNQEVDFYAEVYAYADEKVRGIALHIL